jgi:hypothetical protein
VSGGGATGVVTGREALSSTLPLTGTHHVAATLIVGLLATLLGCLMVLASDAPRPNA